MKIYFVQSTIFVLCFYPYLSLLCMFLWEIKKLMLVSIASIHYRTNYASFHGNYFVTPQIHFILNSAIEYVNFFCLLLAKIVKMFNI